MHEESDDEDEPVRNEVTGLEFVAQTKSNWCWAASSLMMRRFYLEETLDLEDVVREYSPDLANVQSALRLSRLRSSTPIEGRKLTWDEIKAQIDTNKPFIFARAYHYLVCYGYEESSSANRLLCWDPLPTGNGAHRTHTYQQYSDLIDNNGATSHDFTIMPREVLLPMTLSPRYIRPHTSITIQPRGSDLQVTRTELRVRLAKNRRGDVGAVIYRETFDGVPSRIVWTGKVDRRHRQNEKIDISDEELMIELMSTLELTEKNSPSTDSTQVKIRILK